MDNEKYAMLVRSVHKIVSLADELIEQNNELTEYVQGLELQGQQLPELEIPARDMVSALLQNYSGQRHATGVQAKMELLREAINNISKLADLFVARNCYLIKRIHAHLMGMERFRTNDRGIN
ncbi:hypothetical protein niasHS_001637 [Heterodera schachtii]|uniref:Uncharacterized protein n=1 Tax=Heterodera schachtii TaxID=97005 RepID=A0ABD2KE15_HETSC